MGTACPSGSTGIAAQAAWPRLLHSPHSLDFWAPGESSERQPLPFVTEPHAAPARLRRERGDRTALRREALEALELPGRLWRDSSGHRATIQSHLGSPHGAPTGARGTTWDSAPCSPPSFSLNPPVLQKPLPPHSRLGPGLGEPAPGCWAGWPWSPPLVRFCSRIYAGRCGALSGARCRGAPVPDSTAPGPLAASLAEPPQAWRGCDHLGGFSLPVCFLETTALPLVVPRTRRMTRQTNKPGPRSPQSE